MKKLILFLLLYILYTSCSHQKEDVLHGIWAFQSIEYNNCDMLTSFTLNTLDLDKDSLCELPEVQYNFCGISPNLNIVEEEGKYSIVKLEKEYYLIIDSKNDLFRGRYLVYFFVDEKEGLFKMIMESEKLKIRLTKVFFLDFYSRRKDVDYWVNCTKNSRLGGDH